VIVIFSKNQISLSLYKNAIDEHTFINDETLI